MRTLNRVLIVEDDDELRSLLAASARERGYEVLAVATCQDGLRGIEDHPDLVILDVRLPDGSGVEVVERCSELFPMPLVVSISGEASPEEAFKLSQSGVSGYLAKPHSIDELWDKVREASQQPPDIKPAVAATVGHRPMREVQDDVRRVMVDQAMGMTHGSRRGAARLLHVSRQAVQQFLRRSHRAHDELGHGPGSESGSG
jgi:DNA-binding NtrC family response regulator